MFREMLLPLAPHPSLLTGLNEQFLDPSSLD